MGKKHGFSGLVNGVRGLADRLGDTDDEPRGRDEESVERHKETAWTRAEDHAHIAPVHGEPTLEPADSPWEVAMMAGWGDPRKESNGFDTFEGIDLMTTGDVDATKELEVESGTAGTPLQLGPSEDLDRHVAPERELGFEDPCGGNWCTHL